MKRADRYTDELPHFYTTTRDEILYAYATHDSRIVRPYHWTTSAITFKDPLLVRIFKSLDSWERWETMLAQLPEGMRFEFHIYHTLSKAIRYFRPSVWAMFMPRSLPGPPGRRSPHAEAVTSGRSACGPRARPSP